MADPAMNRVATDLAEGYDDVVRGIGRMAKHLGADGGDAVSEAAEAFVQAAADLAEKIKKQSESLVRKAEEQVSEHPVAAAAVVAAVVGLLGYAITHKRKPSKLA